jgi:hypothetical protein
VNAGLSNEARWADAGKGWLAARRPQRDWSRMAFGGVVVNEWSKDLIPRILFQEGTQVVVGRHISWDFGKVTHASYRRSLYFWKYSSKANAVLICHFVITVLLYFGIQLGGSAQNVGAWQ